MSVMLHRIVENLRKPSISRLIVGMALVVIVTVIAGGTPAVVAIWLQLERQVWLRVEDVQAATEALYDGERERVEALAALTAQRPTLHTLVLGHDIPALASYLDDLQQGIDADALVVITGAGHIVGHSPPELPAPDVLLNGRDLPFADFVALDDPPGLLVIAAHEVPPAEGEEAGARLIVARELDDGFMWTLQQQTGLAQSLIVGDVRAATSLIAAPDWSLDPDAARGVVHSGAACCTVGTSNKQVYYVGLAPLTDNQGRVVALSEVALAGREIRAGMWWTVAILFGVGLGVAAGGSALAIVLTRRITRPLSDLAEAATRLGTGDLETPIFSTSNLLEISQLARELGRTRRRLRRAQRILRQESARTERILHAIHEGVVTLDEAGRITFFNADTSRILGIPPIDALEKHYGEVFRPAPDETITLHEVLHPPEGAPPINRLTVLDAQDRPVTLAVFTSWLTLDTPPYHLRERVLVLRDISEEEAVNRLRSNFLANVSHEFRTPLSAVIATTELLLEEGPGLTTGEVAELSKTIRMSTLHLRNLVDNLLESARIEAGSFRVRFCPATLPDIVDKAVQTMTPLLRRRGQRLEIDLPADLPTLYADPDRLAQVLVNLLANASKFSPMGALIVLSAKQGYDALTVAVLDSGPGLPAGQFADLFKRFVMGEPSRGAQYGIGLGLSVVKAIVETHGGQVGAENRPEGGAMVWFTLPFGQPMER